AQVRRGSSAPPFEDGDGRDDRQRGQQHETEVRQGDDGGVRHAPPPSPGSPGARLPRYRGQPSIPERRPWPTPPGAAASTTTSACRCRGSGRLAALLHRLASTRPPARSPPGTGAGSTRTTTTGSQRASHFVGDGDQVPVEDALTPGEQVLRLIHRYGRRLRPQGRWLIA